VRHPDGAPAFRRSLGGAACPGSADHDHELIVGLQTSAPLRRAIMPAGGLRVVEAGLKAYGYELDPAVRQIFTVHRKTHNAGVFDAYPADVLAARRSHIITGLLNPMMASPDGVITVDAKMRLADVSAEPSPTLRRLR
jgi:pyruvate-formate lyase